MMTIGFSISIFLMTVLLGVIVGMVDLSRILASPDIASLREAVATAFEEVELEKTNFERIVELDERLKKMEEKP